MFWTKMRVVQTYTGLDQDHVVQVQRQYYFWKIWYWTVVLSERPYMYLDAYKDYKYVSNIGWPLIRS